MNNLNTRQQQIIESLSLEGEKSVEWLAKRFKISDMTTRRDLSYLEELGQIHRTWGGAKIGERQLLDFSFRERDKKEHEEKKRIAEMAAGLVKPNSAVLIDTGTTTLQVARFLKHITPINVFTCSLPVVSELLGVPGITVTILGGAVRSATMEAYGPLTEKNFSSIQADLAILGTDAVGPKGELLTTGMETARVSELMMQVSRKKILVADHTKWDNSAPIKYGELSAVDIVITGKALSKDKQKAMQNQNIELILA